MGQFDTYNDGPKQIGFEGQEISINFDKTSPTTARITWNIPPSVQGCAGIEKYDGIVITLDTTHTNVSKSPVNGQLYTADPTGDFDLHAGDKINTSLVVGAFYGDNTTTLLDISGLTENQEYYVSGFAVDQEKRYHTQGVHTYSLNKLTEFGKADRAAFQNIQISNVLLNGSDPTGLSLIDTYSFEFIINDPNKFTNIASFPDPGTRQVVINDNLTQSISIDGINAQTIDSLIEQMNIQFMKCENPFTNSSPPNTGAFYWNITQQKLFQWDGYKNIEQPVILEDSDPTNVILNSYWFDGTTLFNWDGSTWNTVTPIIKYHKFFTNVSCDDYWFDGTTGYNWDGQVWCSDITFVQENDPAAAPKLDCGTFWYDQVNEILLKLSNDCHKWIPTDVIYWNQDPNALSVGTYWYNDVDQQLSRWNGTVWVNITATISIIEPPTPAINEYWVNPETNIIQQWDGTIWVGIPAIIFDADPTLRESCGLWWNSTTDQLFIWDITTASWDLVVNFLQQVIDPLLPAKIATGTYWHIASTETLFQWDGIEWVEKIHVDYPTDPTIRVIGDIFFNTITMVWYTWDGTNWIVINTINSPTDPNTLPIGTYWFNTTNDTLQQWNGLIWVGLAYLTNSPAPPKDTLWFNTNDNLLYIWDGTEWKLEPGKISAHIFKNCIQFQTRLLGSSANILIKPETDNLFKFLNSPGIKYLPDQDGQDGVSNLPLYEQIGVGTDGSPDERRELIDSIRVQLGYPVVEVELTKQQFDTCIDAGIEELRKRSSIAYKRGFIFLDLQPETQRYFLTNKAEGFNKIVKVSNISRQSSAYIAGLYDNAAFGQIAIQHLYNLGTYDLLTYHIVSEYTEQLEQLFATRVLFQWNERTRALDVFQSVHHTERVLLDVSMERTEQDLINDRHLKTWIENWAMSQAMILLSQIRGKYGSLPGAGGVSLNAGDLYAQAQDIMNTLLLEIDDMIVELPEEFGMESTLIIG